MAENTMTKRKGEKDNNLQSTTQNTEDLAT
jgi:hypothetical protein